MIKVLHVYRTCYPETRGGIEQVIRQITRDCKKFHIESKVLSISKDGSGTKYVEGTELTLCKNDIEIFSNNFSFELFKKYKALSDWADIIHFHYPWPTGDLISFFDKKPKIVTYHSDIVKQKILKKIYFPLEQFFLSKAKKIIATSPQYSQYSYNLNKYRNKVSIIPLAVSPEECICKNPLWEDNERLAFLKGGYFLFLGVLRYYKGLEFLVDAARKNGLVTVIAGTGPMYKKLERKIKNNKIDNVILTGFVSDEEKLKLIANCRAFVFPSHLRSEAFGVSILEAQMNGKAIISCNISTGTSLININGKTGFEVPPGDSEALSNAMIELYNNPKLANQFGSEGYKRSRSLFNTNRQAKLYYNIYKGVLDKWTNN